MTMRFQLFSSQRPWPAADFSESLYSKHGHDSSKHHYIQLKKASLMIPADFMQNKSNSDFEKCNKPKKLEMKGNYRI